MKLTVSKALRCLDNNMKFNAERSSLEENISLSDYLLAAIQKNKTLLGLSCRLHILFLFIGPIQSSLNCLDEKATKETKKRLKAKKEALHWNLSGSRKSRFADAVRSEIYVDKTDLILYTNKYLGTEQKFLCVNRLRRFGKSMALKMLAAYYSRGCDSRELFAGLEIENAPFFEEHGNRYDVILLNMQQFLIRATKQSVTDYLEQAVMAELREIYGDLFRIRSLSGKIYRLYGNEGSSALRTVCHGL